MLICCTVQYIGKIYTESWTVAHAELGQKVDLRASRGQNAGLLRHAALVGTEGCPRLMQIAELGKRANF